MPTPFSQTIVRDSFTRADSGTLGANWTSVSDAISGTVFSIVSNAAKPVATGTRAGSFWNANTFKSDQYAQCIAGGSATGTNTHLVGPAVRMSAGGYYFFTWNELGGALTFQIAKVIGGVFTSLGSTSSAISLNSLLRLEVVGTQLSAYANGVLILQVSDPDLTSGAPGLVGFMAASSPTAFATNWEGGNLIWTRRGTVIPIGTGGGTQEPVAIYQANPKILSPNPDGKIWKMWFTNGWVNPNNPSVYYAEAPDAISWTQYSGNPVIGDASHFPCHGVVFHNDGTYYGYFVNDPLLNSVMDLWTSADGITWAKTHPSVLTVGAGGSWEDSGIFNPVVWVENGSWFMLYTGRTTVGSALYAIGLATSPDGIVWTKYPGNPVITGLSPGNGKTVIANGSLHYLVAFTATANSILPTDIVLYSSTDLHTWVASTKNPVYQRVLSNEGANLSTGQVADPCWVELNGTTYMFHDAIDTQAAGHIHNNLATAPFSMLQLVGMISGNFILAGNVGVAGATVNYSGTASGSVFSDSLGNYVIPIFANGPYTITPVGSFSPSSRAATINNADVTDVNFSVISSPLITAGSSKHSYSPPDMDHLQIKDQRGNVLSWIDGFGRPGGNLSAISSTPSTSLPAPKAQRVIIGDPEADCIQFINTLNQPVAWVTFNGFFVSSGNPMPKAKLRIPLTGDKNSIFNYLVLHSNNPQDALSSSLGWFNASAVPGGSL